MNINDEIRLNKAKDLAKAFLHLPISSCGDISPKIIAHHPFFLTCIVYDRKNDCFINALEQKTAFKKYLVRYERDVIDPCKSIMDIVEHMNKPYVATYLKYAEDMNIISCKQCGNIYGRFWQSIEFSSENNNVTKRRFIKWLSCADKISIMSKEDIKLYNQLEDEIIVYRGVSDIKYKNGLSWTTDLDIAQFFANRFKITNKSYVYKGVVNKENVIAFYNAEKEIIVDYKKVRNIERLIL